MILKKTKAIGFVIYLATFLNGCAIQPPAANYKEVSNNKFDPGKGPFVSDIIKYHQKNIKEITAQLLSHPNELIRDKFETDAEFEKRVFDANAPIFLVAPIKTTREEGCESAYDRSMNVYKIENCFPFMASRIIFEEENLGAPLFMGNAYDSRSIKRKIWNTYKIFATFDWSAEYKLSIKDAKDLDGDLMAGIIILNPKVAKTCEPCRQRELEDSLADLRKSLAAFNGRAEPISSDGWRNDAFKIGEISEHWDHSLTISGVERIVIFKKSDQRVLSDRMYNRVP